MNKAQILRSLNDVYTRIGVAKHGVGVIAIRSIPKGVNPFKRCDPFGDVVKIPEEALNQCDAPKEAKEMIKDFCALQDGIYYVPNYGIDAIDKFYFLNHSSLPNMITLDKGETFITSRRIKKGEELTVDYGSYNEATHFAKK